MNRSQSVTQPRCDDAHRSPTESGHRRYFLSVDRGEPPHLYIQGAGGFAKVWLSPVALASSANLGEPAIRRIQRIIEQRQAEFLESWDEFFAN